MTDTTTTATAGAPSKTVGWIELGLGVLLIAVSVVSFFLLKGSVASESIALSTIAALVLLASTLAGLIVTTKGLGALTPGEALALPSGSVRALLAFSLVIAFVAVSSWSLSDHGFRSGLVHTTEAFPETDLAARLKTVEQAYPAPHFMTIASSADVVAGPVGPGAATTSSDPAVAAKPPPTDQMVIRVYDQAGEQQFADLQKQIVTTLATILVAVVGFYFGGKSATDAANTATDAIDRVRAAMTGGAGGAGGAAGSGAALTGDGLTQLVTQIGGLADAGQALVTDLGDAPADVLKEALAGSTDAALQQKLADAQQALADLTAAAQALATDKSRAADAVAGLAAGETDQAKLAPIGTRLQQLLTDATASGQAATAAHDRFTSAREAITAATAQG
jgi:hypothetical protein